MIQALNASNRFDGILSLKLKLSEEELMIKDSVAILTNALRQMYYTHNITTPPTDCSATLSSKWKTGQVLYNILKKQKYNGRSGRITFDDYGDRLFSEYDILNVHNHSEHVVGKYMFSSLDMKMSLTLMVHLIKWPGNQLQKPLGFYVPKHLKIATHPEKPFMWAHPIKGNQDKCKPHQIPCPKRNLTTNQFEYFCCEGYCGDLLKELANKLNFTYSLELIADGQYGNYEYTRGNSTRRWTGLVGALVYKRVDMVVAPLTANPERSQVISFSKPFKYEGITMLQKRQPRKATLASFLQPFQNTLWVLGKIV